MSLLTGVKIRAISASCPRKTARSEDAPSLTGVASRRFIKSVGISERRIADSGTFSSDLAREAAKQALGDLGWSEVDLLVAITQTPDRAIPGIAVMLQHQLGLSSRVPAFDINLGCSSVPYGVSVVASLMKSLGLKRGILVIADISSRLCDLEDAGTSPLFGDAGGAIALELDETGTMVFDLNTDGSGIDAITVRGAGLASRSPPSFSANTETHGDFYLSMKGSDVFSFAISKAPDSITRALSEYEGLNANAVVPAIVVLHQANKMINDTIAKKLAFPQDVVFPTSLQDFGNTSSVTLPVTLASQFGGSSICGVVVLCGFGVGLSWGTLVHNFDDVLISNIREIE